MSYKYKLYGAILGDMVGRPYEYNYKGDYSDLDIHTEKGTFTDDTLMTLASAKSLLDNTDIEIEYKLMGNKYKGDYYGKNFKDWLKTDIGTTLDSWGNGCIMRVSPFMYNKDFTKLIKSVVNSHSHPISVESVIKLWKAYQGEFPITYPVEKFKKFEVIADKTVDFCINLYQQTNSTQEAILTAIKCGGDTDTNASIVGELSNFYRKDITQEDVVYVESKLDNYLINILHKFNEKY